MAHWYHSGTKTYIVAFAKIFSDIHIKRIDAGDVEVKDIKVPLVYASKNKLSYQLAQNADTSSTSIVLPVIGFNIESLEFDPVRKLNSLNSRTVGQDQSIYEGIPYNYNFSVNIKSKYQDDLWQMLEQILYYFKPDTFLDVKELPFADYVRDVKVILESTDLNMENEYDQDSSREVGATLNFILQGFIYPPTTADTVIHHVDVNFINNLDLQIVNLTHDWMDPNIVTTLTEDDGVPRISQSLPPV
jgi:hypothetical protein